MLLIEEKGFKDDDHETNLKYNYIFTVCIITT